MHGVLYGIKRFIGGEKYTYKNSNNEKYTENKLYLSIFIIIQYLNISLSEKIILKILWSNFRFKFFMYDFPFKFCLNQILNCYKLISPSLIFD